MTSSKKLVRSAVFSIRFVVASMSEKVCARAAYGTGCPAFQGWMSTSLILLTAHSALGQASADVRKALRQIGAYFFAAALETSASSASESISSSPSSSATGRASLSLASGSDASSSTVFAAFFARLAAGFAGAVSSSSDAAAVFLVRFGSGERSVCFIALTGDAGLTAAAFSVRRQPKREGIVDERTGGCGGGAVFIVRLDHAPLLGGGLRSCDSVSDEGV